MDQLSGALRDHGPDLFVVIFIFNSFASAFFRFTSMAAPAASYQLLSRAAPLVYYFKDQDIQPGSGGYFSALRMMSSVSVWLHCLEHTGYIVDHSV